MCAYGSALHMYKFTSMCVCSQLFGGIFICSRSFWKLLCVRISFLEAPFFWFSFSNFQRFWFLRDSSVSNSMLEIVYGNYCFVWGSFSEATIRQWLCTCPWECQWEFKKRNPNNKKLQKTKFDTRKFKKQMQNLYFTLKIRIPSATYRFNYRYKLTRKYAYTQYITRTCK